MKYAQGTPHPDAATGDLTRWGGICAGRVTAWAEALGTSPEAVVNAADEVPPLVDTGAAKPRESHDRPTDPTLRCIAWNWADVERVRDTLPT